MAYKIGVMLAYRCKDTTVSSEFADKTHSSAGKRHLGTAF